MSAGGTDREADDVAAAGLPQTRQIAQDFIQLAGQIVAKSPLTLAIGKEAFYRQAEMGLDDAYAFASEAMTRKFSPSLWVARCTLTPPEGIALEPPVPRPVAIMSVSPWNT